MTSQQVLLLIKNFRSNTNAQTYLRTVKCSSHKILSYSFEKYTEKDFNVQRLAENFLPGGNYYLLIIFSELKASDNYSESQSRPQKFHQIEKSRDERTEPMEERGKRREERRGRRIGATRRPAP